MSYTSYRYDIFKCKKRLPIKSLQAAICNVALFKNMKEKQFRDTIYISYCEDGVILESTTQAEWDRACDYVLDFLFDKKIALLTYGHEKEIYQQLIAKGLKEYTRRIKQQGEQCPYINIIHYQKLRKSCEYMDKQKYTDPLRYWESKFKTNPNFAFLIVQPKDRFHEVKRYLLQVLLKREITLKIEYVSLYEFLYLFYNSKNKDEIRQLCDRKIIQAQIIEKQQMQEESELNLKSKKQNQKSLDSMKELQQKDYVIKLINYSELSLSDYEIKIIKHTGNLAKLGLQYISSKEIEKQTKTVAKYLRGLQIEDDSDKKVPTVLQIYDKVHTAILNEIKTQAQTSKNPNGSYGAVNQSDLFYSMIPYRKCEKEKYLGLLSKLIKTTTQIKNKNLQQINNELKKLQICEYDQIEFLSILPLKQRNKNDEDFFEQIEENYNVYKVSIYDCPYMLVEYHQIPMQDLDTFILYLEQLKTYYCTYLVRFYGISIRYGENIHQTHADILQDANPSLLEKIQKPQSHSYKQLSKSKLEQYSYYLIFDYHHRSLQTLIQNDLILDNLQIANMALQILYLCQYLHQHDQPRCLGMINLQQIYWPLTVVLPYLGHRSITHFQNKNKPQKSILSQFKFNFSEEGFEGDVKLVGKLMQHLMTSQHTIQESQQKDQSFAFEQGSIDKQIQNLWKSMTKQNKYDRITIARAINTLEEILSL